MDLYKTIAIITAINLVSMPANSLTLNEFIDYAKTNFGAKEAGIVNGGHVLELNNTDYVFDRIFVDSTFNVKNGIDACKTGFLYISLDKRMGIPRDTIINGKHEVNITNILFKPSEDTTMTRLALTYENLPDYMKKFPNVDAKSLSDSITALQQREKEMKRNFKHF